MTWRSDGQAQGLHRASEMGAFHASQTNRSCPLRKIVRHGELKSGLMVEVLECGHYHVVREYLFGAYYGAKRRRCHKCRTEAPPDAAEAV